MTRKNITSTVTYLELFLRETSSLEECEQLGKIWLLLFLEIQSSEKQVLIATWINHRVRNIPHLMVHRHVPWPAGKTEWQAFHLEITIHSPEQTD